MSRILFPHRLLICCGVLTLTASAFAANGPSPGKSPALPTVIVTPENQHLFNAARARLFEISQRAEADYADRLEKLQTELLRSLRERPKKNSAQMPCENCASERLSSEPCENCVADRSLTDCESCDREFAVDDCENCDRDIAPVAVLRPLSEPGLLACESCGIPSPKITEPAIAPLFAKPAPLTEGALTFDDLPIDDDSDIPKVVVADDEVPSENPTVTEPNHAEITHPISFEESRARLETAITQFVSTMKLFGLWPEVRPARAEFKTELVALEEQVASLQARIENLKRLTDEK